MLGLYAVLLLAVAAAILALVLNILVSRSAGYSDRLAEVGDLLGGGTLMLAAIAGLVALQAYASATGLPRLVINARFEGPGDGSSAVLDESMRISTPLRATGPFTVLIRLKNESGYSARNPAVILSLQGVAVETEAPALSEGWTITRATTTIAGRRQILEVQWDGGPCTQSTAAQ